MTINSGKIMAVAFGLFWAILILYILMKLLISFIGIFSKEAIGFGTYVIRLRNCMNVKYLKRNFTPTPNEIELIQADRIERVKFNWYVNCLSFAMLFVCILAAKDGKISVRTMLLEIMVLLLICLVAYGLKRLIIASIRRRDVRIGEYGEVLDCYKRYYFMSRHRQKSYLYFCNIKLKDDTILYDVYLNESEYAKLNHRIHPSCVIYKVGFERVYAVGNKNREYKKK